MPVSGRVYGVSVRADAFELTEDNEILVSSVPSQIGGGEGEGFFGLSRYLIVHCQTEN